MTKVDIISGFLGAGKTTLISKLLKEALKGEQVVLIENEFGEIGIDGGFLKDSGVEIREMNSGCICCSLVGDFGTSNGFKMPHALTSQTRTSGWGPHFALAPAVHRACGVVVRTPWCLRHFGLGGRSI